MRRRVSATAMAFLLAGCGGSPTSPDVAESVVLAPGAYRLALHLARGTDACSNGICTTLVLCIGRVTLSTGFVPVSVSRDGEDVVVRPDDSRSTMTMTLRVSGDAVSGAIAGRAYDSGGQPIDVAGLGNAPADMTGTPAGRAIYGTLNGHVSIAGASCAGGRSEWRLEPAG